MIKSQYSMSVFYSASGHLAHDPAWFEKIMLQTVYIYCYHFVTTLPVGKNLVRYAMFYYFTSWYRIEKEHNPLELVIVL